MTNNIVSTKDMGWVGLGWVGLVYNMLWVGLGWVCTLVGWVGLGFKKLAHVHVWLELTSDVIKNQLAAKKERKQQYCWKNNKLNKTQDSVAFTGTSHIINENQEHLQHPTDCFQFFKLKILSEKLPAKVLYIRCSRSLRKQ